jgi:ATP-binding cassette, subfamily B, bacterial MsbA
MPLAKQEYRHARSKDATGLEMKNLGRALRMSFRYKWSIISSTLCAFLVAILWGANIGGALPLIEIVFRGRSMQGVVEDRIDTSRLSIEKAESKIRELEQELPAADAADRRRIEKAIAGRRDLIEAEFAGIRRMEALRPWVREYLPEDPFQTLLLVFSILFIATLLRCFFLSINMYLVDRTGRRTILDIQDRLFRNTLQMEPHELGVKGTADLVNRIRGETNAIALAITVIFGKLLREPLKMGACIIGAALLNWRLLLFSLVVVPMAAFVLLTLARITKRAQRRAIEESAVLLNRLFQALTYQRVVRAYNMEEHEHDRFRTTATAVYRKSMKISLLGALARTNSEVLGVVVVAMSAIAGAWLVLNRETHMLGVRLCSTPMTPGEIMLFYGFLIGVSDPLRKLGDVFNIIQSGEVSAERVFPLFDRIPEIRDADKPAAFPAGTPSIRFENVVFSYPDPESGETASLQPPALAGISFEIPAGTSLAIVGANGCGKSTLINLLLRFFDPQSGRVLVGGNDIRDYRLSDLRKAIGYVTQQTMLFADSIATNIRYGALEADESRVRDAARRAHAEGFISRLPAGFEANIGEHGASLSGGQRQRLSLARAILRNAPVLVLDEATSQVDPESELLIHRSLAEFVRRRTTIMVTHRLSTLELADRILVMHDGLAVDCGTHVELIARCAAYRRLRATQQAEAA